MRLGKVYTSAIRETRFKEVSFYAFCIALRLAFPRTQSVLEAGESVEV